MEQTRQFLVRRNLYPTFTRSKSRRAHTPALDVANLLLLPFLVTMLMWTMSLQQISLPQAMCAWLLLCFPWGAFLSWRRKRRYEATLFGFVAGMYWLYYGVALFFGNRLIISIQGGTLTDEAITQAMFMAVVGVTCLWAGMRTPLGRKILPCREPEIPSNPARWNYVRTILALGVLFSLVPGTAYLLGEGGRQFIVGLQNIVPMVAFIILFRLYLKECVTWLDKVLLMAYFFSKLALGISGGWLGSIIYVVLACFIVYLSEKRRPPWLVIAPVLLYMLFFQAGKAAFRSETWNSADDSGGIAERMERWTTLSFEAWRDALDDTTGEKRTQLLTQVIMRTSLLTQTAYVIEQTPEHVPFQFGSTYSYLAATWIPRALWPDKPSASEANRFYQVAYGLTEEENLDSVSIAVGSMTEGYINFGWFGVVGIMYLLGLLFNWTEKVFLSRNAGWLIGSLGIMLVTRLIGIEAQMAMYISGLLQQLMLVFLIFLPILHWRKTQLGKS